MDFLPRTAADMPIDKQNKLLMAFCVALLHEKSLDGKIGKLLRALADEAHKGHEGNLMECREAVCMNAAASLCECRAMEANFRPPDLQAMQRFQLRTGSPVVGSIHISIEEGAKLNLIQV